jgi:hypothetical protein
MVLVVWYFEFNRKHASVLTVRTIPNRLTGRKSGFIPSRLDANCHSIGKVVDVGTT